MEGNSLETRDIRSEMFNVKGSDFKQWYESLTEQEVKIYKSILEEIENEKPNSNSSKI